MKATQAIVLIGAVVAIVLVFYVILTKLKLAQQNGLWLRAVLFFAMMGYLAYDFYMREKYGYIAFLAIGSIAFVLLLRAKKRE
ncbi:MAG: hypothetical protein MUE96_06500 [Bacteroidia bacterium]|jgi:hypothetical protein|nr:hypothetical protein [Bacteroidia bacterium]